MKKKIITYIVMAILIILIIGIVIANFVGSNSQTQELEKINVSEVTRSVFYSPQYIAINNGFFEKYGIEIELTTGQRS